MSLTFRFVKHHKTSRSYFSEHAFTGLWLRDWIFTLMANNDSEQQISDQRVEKYAATFFFHSFNFPLFEPGKGLSHHLQLYLHHHLCGWDDRQGKTSFFLLSSVSIPHLHLPLHYSFPLSLHHSPIVSFTASDGNFSSSFFHQSLLEFAKLPVNSLPQIFPQICARDVYWKSVSGR